VVWHTQGSGKSLTMAFYAGRMILEPEMENPTIVVLTDRNDLDDQLFGTFARCHDLLRQTPVQAERPRRPAREAAGGSGGVVFTTIQKFFPEEKGDRHPSSPTGATSWSSPTRRTAASTTSSTASPGTCATRCPTLVHRLHRHADREDRRTRAPSSATTSASTTSSAPSRTAPPCRSTTRAGWPSSSSRIREKPKIDPDFEEVTEGEEVERKEKLKSKWAQLEAMVGAEKRASSSSPKDLVEHFEKRLEAMDGKAMVVCMSRRICVELYREIVKLRPEWHGADEDDDKGAIKVVMTGSASDPLDWQQHIRNKPRREALAKRFKDPADPFKIVIVRDMWLTGFDAPSLHTMYVDKPMRGHGLMQAIARVNRVFKDKPGGWSWTTSAWPTSSSRRSRLHRERRHRQDRDRPGRGRRVMLEKYEVCCGLFHGFDWSLWRPGTRRERLIRCSRRRRSTSSPRTEGKRGCCGGHRALAGLRARRAARRGARDPRRRRLLPGGAGRARQERSRRAARPTRSSTTPSGRSSRGRSPPTRSSTSSPPPG
jgi:type I restriction enzyme R subunit